MEKSYAKGLLVLGALFILLWSAERIYLNFYLTTAEPRTVTPRGALADFEKQNIDVFERISPSVAYISIQVQRPTLFGISGARDRAGSGFLWDTAGHVVTNYHVVKGATAVAVKLDTGDSIRATVVGVSPEYDLAVVRLTTLPSGLRPIPIGSSADLKVGQTVFAIGNPFGLSRTLTTGIISALNRRLPTERGWEVEGVIQTDAAINPGNSGGPLLDSAGRLIGVNTAIISPSGSSSGVGFSVPVDVVNKIVPQLIKKGKAARPGIGIKVASEETAARLGVEGVVVIQVLPGGSADRAGVRGVDPQTSTLGDIIIAVNGKRVKTVAELSLEMDKIGIGNTSTLTVLRGGLRVDLQMAIMDIS